MESIGRLVALLAGAALTMWVGLSAVRSVGLPRGEPVALTRAGFVGVCALFNLWTRRAKSYERRDRSLAMYAPICLVALPGAWVTLVLLGFTAIDWGLGVDPLRGAFFMSGSSLFPLGLDAPPDVP